MIDSWKMQNREFWKEQALNYKSDVKTVNFDPLEEELELHYLQQVVKDGENVLDIGCGNGRTTIALALKNRKSVFYGVDFTEEMIAVAEEQKKLLNVTNINFYRTDATSKDIKKMFGFKFDRVISKRLLINIKGENKYNAIKNVHYLLKDRGFYIMIECFIEPLVKINEIRKALKLEEIKVKPFNEYLTLNFLDKIKESFEIKKKVDFESLYYFTSRIYNAYLFKENLDYLAPINKLAVIVEKMNIKTTRGYSPEILFVLRKR